MEQTRYTNNTGISLAAAVWLAHDDYDHVKEEKYVSATGLLKPTRQIILSGRVNADGDVIPDIASEVSAAMGQSLHAGIEKAWSLEHYQTNLRKLGYPERVVSLVRINPTDAELKAEPDILPVYIEQRATRQIVVGGVEYTIGGKYDIVIEGRLNDIKSTSVYTYIHQTNVEKYSLQGSIYRWLNPEKITDDHIYIQYLFTDWAARFAKSDAKYPRSRVLEFPVRLKSLQETENFIRAKLTELQRYKDAPEPQLPLCTSEELWRSDPVFKYYKNPASMSRSTKNFDSLHEANLYLAKQGVGIVVTRPGEVKACRYCAGFAACSQKDDLILSGDLKMEP